jgi:hypothetical protein
MDLGKMSKEKLRSCLNLTGTPNSTLVAHVFVELHLVQCAGAINLLGALLQCYNNELASEDQRRRTKMKKKKKKEVRRSAQV